MASLITTYSQLLIDGLTVTLKISFGAIAVATVLGVTIFALEKHRVARLIILPYKSLIHGVPMLLFLLIFKFVLFGNVNPVTVSILCFGIIFSVDVCNNIRSGFESIDRDILLAAKIDGSGAIQTAYYIVAPLIVKISVYSYTNTIVGLIKSTAIVGYIGVQDLTKVSDIIKTRTYEVFVPLIIVAVVYF